jgi:predicted MFS family arabinose efflux permease
MTGTLLQCHQVAAAGLTFQAVVATRVCVGLGEGVALPSMNNLVATLPKARQSTALGVAFTGFHCGEAVHAPDSSCASSHESSRELAHLDVVQGLRSIHRAVSH